jgi:hypothetical protein
MKKLPLAFANGLIPGLGHFINGNKKRAFIQLGIGGAITILSVFTLYPVCFIIFFFEYFITTKVEAANPRIDSESLDTVNIYQKETLDAKSNLNSTSNASWKMQTKETAWWKFLLGNCPFKNYQLHSVHLEDNTLYVKVNSGKVTYFKSGDYTANFFKSKEGLRSFKIKSISESKNKVSFSEVQLQMPEEWWDDLAKKIGAKESGMSKVMHGIKGLTES